jgi:multiple antibiotic resistance protein
MITAPFDPLKVLLFNGMLGRSGANRGKAAGTVTLAVLVILGVSAVVGREILDLMGINLGAFGFVGGLVVAGMGFEMLYTGTASKAQGKDVVEDEADADTGLVIPLSMPLIAGPGAITTVITMTSKGAGATAVLPALLAVAIVGVVTFVSFAFLSEVLAKVSRQTTQFLQRIGGLLLATIGCQLALGGIRTFYGF